MLVSSSAIWAHVPAQTSAAIVFMTDFGVANDAVAICKGVMIQIAPQTRIMDITHLVTPYSIADGARFLAGTAPYYPSGSVFVVVIDPGVGSTRKAIVVKSKRGQYFVLPDNGLITALLDRDGMEGAREITNRSWMINAGLSSTFHGRDIFSPVGAHLARGEDWRDVGPEIKQLVRLELPSVKQDANGIEASIIALDDPYGNLITNISREDFQKLGYAIGDLITVKVGDQEIAVPYVKTFSDVAVGKPLLYIDSRGRAGLAVNQGNFSEVYKLGPPLMVKILSKTSLHKGDNQ
ncbi:MAG: SAM-dependent chlorinase/fluorinase [Acidobacteriota bacterium]|nr:SAM-dependent chlorinase/fluorinase [Acidobacteriota bacterium]